MGRTATTTSARSSDRGALRIPFLLRLQGLLIPLAERGLRYSPASTSRRVREEKREETEKK